MMFFVTIKKDNLKQNDDNVLKINARIYSKVQAVLQLLITNLSYDWKGYSVDMS